MTIPHAKRKLNGKHRATIFNSLGTAFQDKKLRLAMVRARNDFVKNLQADVTNFSDAELKTLEKFGLTEKLTALSLPSKMRIKMGVKDFKVGDRSVKRDDLHTFDCPKGEFIGYYTGSNVWGAVKSKSRGRFGTRGDLGALDINTQIRKLNLMVPKGCGTISIKSEDERVWSPDLNSRALCLSKKTIGSLRKFYMNWKAMNDKEQAMRDSIRQILDNAGTFGDVVEILPEVDAMAEDLFGTPVIQKDKSLVPINDDMKAVLCENMKSRGVKAKSLICGSAE